MHSFQNRPEFKVALSIVAVSSAKVGHAWWRYLQSNQLEREFCITTQVWDLESLAACSNIIQVTLSSHLLHLQAPGHLKEAMERPNYNRPFPRLEHILEQYSFGQHDVVFKSSYKVRPDCYADISLHHYQHFYIEYLSTDAYKVAGI